MGSEDLGHQNLGWGLHLCPLPGSGPAEQRAGCRPTQLPNRRQLTLQQDPQEGHSGQKSHLILHGGAGGSVGPAGCKMTGCRAFLSPCLAAAQRLAQERKSGWLSLPFTAEGVWGGA